MVADTEDRDSGRLIAWKDLEVVVGQQQHANGAFGVLVVVDYPPLADVLGLHLQEFGAQASVVTIASHDEILEAIDTVSASVVLIDDRIDANWIEVCRCISTHRPNVGCVVLGTGLSYGASEQALDAGAAAFLVKSLAGDTIREIVRAVVGGYRQQPSNTQVS